MFRIGDFYEAFDDDAKLLSVELDLVLTGRDMARGQRVPLAGVPYHALDGYLARLVQKGYRVAICEQLSDPKASRGLVERDVTRVVTPGTIVAPEMLDERRNNFLVAIVPDLSRRGEGPAAPSFGLSYVDITTGEFATTQLIRDEAHQVDRELERLAPAEVLWPRDAPEDLLPGPARRARVTLVDRWQVELSQAQEALSRHFEVATLDGLGCAGLPLAIRAAAAIVHYIGDNQRASLPLMTELRTYQLDEFMSLDPATRRNLELAETSRSGAARGSLLWVLDRTKTPAGARLLRGWVNQPLVDAAKINRRLTAVSELVTDGPGRTQLREILAGVRDLERLANRIAHGSASPRDLLALRASLAAVPAIRSCLAPESARFVTQSDLGLEHSPSSTPRSPREPDQPTEVSLRRQLAAQLDDCADVVELVDAAIRPDAPATLADGGCIRDGFSPDLDELQQSTEHARRWIDNLEPSERELTGIRTLKVGYNRVFGYYLEVSNANRGLVPDRYIRKQTLVGAERYITPELKDYEAIVLNARERIVETEQTLFRQVVAQISAERQRLLRSARAIAEADAVASLAEVAVQQRYVCPVVDDGPRIEISGGRHPVVEETLTDVPFTPNDVALSTDDAQIVLLTGPNMAGKSTFLRQAALIVLLAQVGSYVPADSAHIGLVDRIFTRVGAQDDLTAGQSTFLVEMLETAHLLNQSTRRSLLVLDEVGRGTSTYDGLAIARAIVEYIHNHPRLGARTLFATHYHELTELAQVLPRVRNFRMDVREADGEVHFLHRIVPGGADRSYGVHVARLAGIPRAVTRRAEEILRELERRGGRPTGERKQARGEVIQLSLIAEPHPVVEELKAMDVLSLSPIEAIAKLFELQQRVRDS